MTQSGRQSEKRGRGEEEKGRMKKKKVYLRKSDTTCQSPSAHILR